MSNLPTPVAAVCLTGSLRAATSDPWTLFVRPFSKTVLARFRDEGYVVHVFAVTSLQECANVPSALGPLNVREVRCIDESSKTPAELRWLRSGPRTSWNREAFLGQTKKVRACSDLLDRHGPPEGYRLIARSRLDVIWHRFPARLASLEVPRVIWLPYSSSDAQSQYINDRFAVGPPSGMWAYLRVYDTMLDRSTWRWLRFFERTSDGLDTEELWETSLLSAGVLARQHREICFNTLSKDPEAIARGELEADHSCQSRPTLVHPHGYIIDASWARLPLHSLPYHYKYDGLFAARLLHLWFAEWSRLGRPAKIMDLGCGRAAHMEKWLRYYPQSIVGVDRLPQLQNLFGETVLDLDLATPIFPRRLGKTRGCRVRLPEGALSLGSIKRSWHQSLLRQCCQHFRCRGLTDNLDELYMGSEIALKPADLGAFPRNLSVLHPNTVPWSGGRADWVVAIDVASEVPAALQGVLFGNIARLAVEGVVATWGDASDGSSQALRHPLEDLGFLRDQVAEDWIRPFAASSRWRKDLRVFRRADLPFAVGAQPCSLKLQPELSKEKCFFGSTFGCVDEAYIWVSQGCSGVFARGADHNDDLVCDSDSGPAAPKAKLWTSTSLEFLKRWKYVECYLPEQSKLDSHAANKTLIKEDSDSSEAGALLYGFICDPASRIDLKLQLRQIRNGYLSEKVQAKHLLSVRLPFSGGAQLVECSSGWPGLPYGSAARSRGSGECLTWNTIPVLGQFVCLRAWSLKVAAVEPQTQSWPSVGLAAPVHISAVWAENFFRLCVRKDGLAGMYDELDPASGWSNQSEHWRSVAWGSVMPDAGVTTRQNFSAKALQNIDSFIAMANVVRLAATHWASAAEPSEEVIESHDDVYLALQRASPRWARCGWRLLAVAGLLQDSPNWTWSAELLQGTATRDCNGSFVLRGLDEGEIQGAQGASERSLLTWEFRQTQLGHYFYHRATLAD